MQQHLDFRKQVTDRAIKRASDHAEAVDPGWNDKAFEFLKEFIKTNSVFMCEDVRYAAQGKLNRPPTEMSWGSVIRRAAKAGLIQYSHTQPVKNIKAHSARASVWHTV